MGIVESKLKIDFKDKNVNKNYFKQSALNLSKLNG